MLKANAKAGNALVLQLDVNATQMCAEIAGLGIEFPCPLTHTHTHTDLWMRPAAYTKELLFLVDCL